MQNKLTIAPAPHIFTKVDTKRIMLMVILALVPSLIASTIIFGMRALILAAVCIAASVIFEALMNSLMKKKQTISDFSAVLTGLLLAMNLPVNVEYWIAVVGCFVAIVVVKGLFGGLGCNITNPAITARVVLLTSFSAEMSKWTIGSGVDAVSTATPLSSIKAGELAGLPSLKTMLLGDIGGSMGEVCAIALIAGGLILIAMKVISPIIPGTFIGTVFVFAVIYYQVTGAGNALEMGLYHVLAGGVMIGAFFMATDYVTSPMLPLGKAIFGVGCGIITMLIRFFGTYPEGVSFAILLMNCLTPLIDNFCEKRLYGGEKNE